MLAVNDRLAHRPTPAGTGRGNEPYSVKFGRTRYATVSPSLSYGGSIDEQVALSKHYSCGKSQT